MPKKLFSGVKLGTIKVRSVIKQKFSVINLKYHFYDIYSQRRKNIIVLILSTLNFFYCVQSRDKLLN